MDQAEHSNRQKKSLADNFAHDLGEPKMKKGCWQIIKLQ
jgi:hypothetical protein